MARKKRTASRQTSGDALRSRIHFQKRSMTIDEMTGDETPFGPFVTQFTCAANIRPLARGNVNGNEYFHADQLQEHQAVMVTVRMQKALREVTSAWRVVDARSVTSSGEFSRVYDLRSPPADPSNDYLWCEFIAIKTGND